MNRTHEQVIEESETKLLNALICGDISVVHGLLHEDFVYINENGELFRGMQNLDINNPEIVRILSVDIEEKTMTFFDSVAIINSVEKRTGTYRGMNFTGQYRLTRVWKFYGGWKLIASSKVLI